MAGIDKTLEVFHDLSGLIVSGVGITRNFKGGAGLSSILGSIGELIKLSKTVEELIKDLPAALPELLDLDADESAIIGHASYELVKKVLDAVKA